MANSLPKVAQGKENVYRVLRQDTLMSFKTKSYQWLLEDLASVSDPSHLNLQQSDSEEVVKPSNIHKGRRVMRS